LFFRSTGRGDGYEYEVAGEGNRICHADAYEQGRLRSLEKGFHYSLEDFKWYTAHVHVRGNRFYCSLYDNAAGRTVGRFDVVDDRHVRGRVGLGTWLSTFRFRNIRVTDPDGHLLWDGPPAIGPSTSADLSQPSRSRQEDGAAAGWASLFNGKDLAGWAVDSGPRDSWRVVNGELVVTGPGDYRKSGFLLTDREYSEFLLRLEFQPSPGANSGVAFWARPGVLFDGIPHHPQIELFDADKRAIKNGSLIWSRSTGVPEILPPYRPVDLKPAGVWNTMEVEVRGGLLRVEFNGRDVFRSDLARLAELPGAHPSLIRRSGRIGLQSHTGTVRFRNIQVSNLDGSRGPGTSADRRASVPVPDEPRRRKRLLAITESAGFAHKVSRMENGRPSLVDRTVQELGESGGFEVITSQDSRGSIKAEWLKGFDAVFFYTTGELSITPDGKAALLDFVRSGKDFAGSHGATDTLYGWPEYGELIGAYFDKHPGLREVTVRIDDPGHPSTTHLARSFKVREEVYQFKTPFSRDKLHILMHFDYPGATHSGAAAWTKRYGAGRVFYTALGHDEAIWRDERFRKHLLGGLLYVLGLDDRSG
jgi:type 1 glutamine amidotransferase